MSETHPGLQYDLSPEVVAAAMNQSYGLAFPPVPEEEEPAIFSLQNAIVIPFKSITRRTDELPAKGWGLRIIVEVVPSGDSPKLDILKMKKLNEDETTK